MAKRKTLEADGTEITILSVNEQEEFFSLTDLAKRINPENPSMLIVNWMRLKDTIAFLGVWEKLNNPSFNLIEFDKVRNEAGYNSFILSAGKWVAMPIIFRFF